MTQNQTRSSLQGTIVVMHGAMVTVRHGKTMARDYVFCPRTKKSVSRNAAKDFVMSSGPEHLLEVCISGCGQHGFACLPKS